MKTFFGANKLDIIKNICVNNLRFGAEHRMY